VNADLPQTLEEWKQFRFPSAPALKPEVGVAVAPAPPVVEAEQEDEDEGEGSGSSGGQVALTPVVLPEPPSPPGSWTYDRARGLLIHWENGRMVSLTRHLGDLRKILRLIAIVEARSMDHLGFVKALDQACQDVHGKNLREISKDFPKTTPIPWGDLPRLEIAVSPERRRRMGVR